MNAEEFLKKLATATPSRDELKKAGRTAVVIEKLLGSRKCERRKRPLNLPQMSGNESLIELFNGWDTGTLSIGGLDFLDVPIDTPGGFQIGKEEVEPVLIAPNGEIVIEERGAGGHRLADVAENGNSFLNALIIVAKFFGDRGRR